MDQTEINKVLQNELDNIEKTLKEVPKLRSRKMMLRKLLGMGKIYKYDKKEKTQDA